MSFTISLIHHSVVEVKGCMCVLFWFNIILLGNLCNSSERKENNHGEARHDHMHNEKRYVIIMKYGMDLNENIHCTENLQV